VCRGPRTYSALLPSGDTAKLPGSKVEFDCGWREERNSRDYSGDASHTLVDDSVSLTTRPSAPTAIHRVKGIIRLP
jgi:hypothetical protein